MRLREASVENGARCLSDFARTAILLGLEGFRRQAVSEAGGKDQMQALLLRVRMVEQSIAKLEQMLSGPPPNEREEMTVGASV